MLLEASASDAFGFADDHPDRLIRGEEVSQGLPADLAGGRGHDEHSAFDSTKRSLGSNRAACSHRWPKAGAVGSSPASATKAEAKVARQAEENGSVPT